MWGFAVLTGAVCIAVAAALGLALLWVPRASTR
jgi:hypothetical protein